MKLSIIVPCYNESGNIIPFYNAVITTFKREKFDYEIIYVNDGSKDNTSEELDKLLSYTNGPAIKIIEFSRNFGKEAAMYAGLKEAKGEFTCIIDADLQQNPKYILKMLQILKKNPDYSTVACYPKQRKENSFLKIFKSMFYSIINKLSVIDFKNGCSDFRLFSRKVVNAILQMTEYSRFSKGIFEFVGFKTYYLEYEVENRVRGQSKWNFIKLLNYAIDGIVGYTTFPLRLSFLFSSVFFLLSIILTIIFIINSFNSFTILLVILLFISSIVFFIIGVFCEYLARIYLETKHRPIYFVDKIKCSKK